MIVAMSSAIINLEQEKVYSSFDLEPISPSSLSSSICSGTRFEKETDFTLLIPKSSNHALTLKKKS